jgi:hypothetical protein
VRGVQTCHILMLKLDSPVCCAAETELLQKALTIHGIPSDWKTSKLE